jgi:Chromo (CHRromatin Organisation MOdifier) domain
LLQIEYFLKWENYSDQENTWEPASSLGCYKLIEEYENSQQSENNNECYAILEVSKNSSLPLTAVPAKVKKRKMINPFASNLPMKFKKEAHHPPADENDGTVEESVKPEDNKKLEPAAVVHGVNIVEGGE